MCIAVVPQRNSSKWEADGKHARYVLDVAVCFYSTAETF